MSFCPPTPRDLGLNEDEWWPGQRETINLIMSAFIEDGKKFVMAGIPTGGGKSLIAAAIQTLLAQSGIGEGKSLAVTFTKQLQHQYRKSLPDAKVLVGRSNFPCELPSDNVARFGAPDLSAADAPCADGQGCELELNQDTEFGCGYYRQRAEAKQASMVITNYAMAPLILMPTDKNGNNPFRRTLLVADECHLAEPALVNVDGVKCSIEFIEHELHIALPSPYTKTTVQEGRQTKEYETNAVWEAWAKDHIDDVDYYRNEQQEYLKSLSSGEKIGSESEARMIRSKVKRAKACLNVMDRLRRITDETRPMFAVQRTDREIQVQPLWGFLTADSLLWRYFDRVLLMSATPGNPDIARIKLGIPEEDFTFIERPSIFPITNRPIYFLPVAKLGYNSEEGEWRKVAHVINQIGSQMPEKKGLVHSGSAQNARRLVPMLNAIHPGRYFTHEEGGYTREEALERFTNSGEPLVLVTASFTTGLDLPYLIGWQVIAKVPFASLADEIVARRRAFVAADGYRFGQAVYQDDAMNIVVQAAGRIVRAPDDSGPTFILDGNYRMLHAQAYKPQFYLDAYQRLDPLTGQPVQ